MSDFYVIITDAGAALEAAALAAGTTVTLNTFGIDDGNGESITPDASQTSLINQVYTGDISSLSVSSDDASVLVAQCIIPASSGGYTIRGIGIFADDGTLYAVGNFQDQVKPEPDSGYAASLEILVELAVSSTADITLQVVDDAYLTKEQADTLYLQINNNLSEIAAAGPDAQAVARQNLGIVETCPYEVDDLYITRSKTDPATRWAGTVWMYLGEGLTLRTAKADQSDLGATVGSDSITLTVDNMPWHGHSIGGSTGSSDAADVTSGEFDYGTRTSSTTGEHQHSFGAENSYYGDSSHTALMAGTGTYEGSSEGNHAHTTDIGSHYHTVTIPAHSHSLPESTEYSGGGTSFSILQQSINVAVWVRTA
ncbi:hypothetical protein FNI11_13575 [Salmonella enterica subsp. salamae]|nr:hypothetical protein [Salmonella enterica subsp. salamae]ECJ2281382.1 hypothetical protein [Salmonella enterica subsp. salamae]